MKRIMNYLALGSLVAVLALFAAACSSAPEPTPTPVPFQPFTDANQGFSLEYPTTWVTGTTEDGMTEFKSAADVNLDINYTGGGLVQVLTIPTAFLETNDPVAVLSLFKDDMVAGMQAEDENSKVTQDVTATTVNGLPAASLIVEAQQGTVNARAEVYIITGDESAALVMVAYPVAEEGTYKPINQRILDSFAFAAPAE